MAKTRADLADAAAKFDILMAFALLIRILLWNGGNCFGFGSEYVLRIPTKITPIIDDLKQLIK